MNDYKEIYYLPVSFTKEENEAYAKWGLKKEKFLVPMIIITILIDILVIVGTVIFLLGVRSEVSGFYMWMQLWSSTVVRFSYILAVVLTLLIIKPMDIILDFVFKRPSEPKFITLTPQNQGILYTISCKNTELKSNIISWKDLENTIFPENNQLILDGEIYKIGYNTISSIYPKEKQHPWLDKPMEKHKNTINLEKIKKNLISFQNSMESQKKETEWLKTHNGM